MKQSSFFPVIRAISSSPILRNGVIAIGIGLVLRTLADNYGITPLVAATGMATGAAYVGYQYIPPVRAKVDSALQEFFNDAATKAMLGR